MHKMILSSVVAMMLFAAGTQQTRASEYGAFVIRNPAYVTIHYQVKWGNGEWRTYSLAPGHRGYHAYPLDEYGRAPISYVRFDYIAGDYDVTYKTYRMNC